MSNISTVLLLMLVVQVIGWILMLRNWSMNFDLSRKNFNMRLLEHQWAVIDRESFMSAEAAYKKGKQDAFAELEKKDE